MSRSLFYKSLLFLLLTLGSLAEGWGQTSCFEKIANLSGDQSLFSQPSLQAASCRLDSLVTAMNPAATFKIGGVDLLPLAHYFDPAEGSEEAYAAHLATLTAGRGEYLSFFVSYGAASEREFSFEFNMPTGGVFDAFTATERLIIANKLRVTFLAYASSDLDYATLETVRHCFRLFSRQEELTVDLAELGFVELRHESSILLPTLEANTPESDPQLEADGIFDYSGLTSQEGISLGATLKDELSTFQTYQTAVYFTSDHSETANDLFNDAASTFGNEQEKFSIWLHFVVNFDGSYQIQVKNHTNLSQEEGLLFLANYFDATVGNHSAISPNEGPGNEINKSTDDCSGKLSDVNQFPQAFNEGTIMHGEHWTAYCLWEDDFGGDFTINPATAYYQSQFGFSAGIIDGLAGTVSGIYILARGYNTTIKNIPFTAAWFADIIVKTVNEKSLFEAWEIKKQEQFQFFETFLQIAKNLVKGISEIVTTMYQEVKAFINKLNPASGWYSTAYVAGLIAFEVIVEVVTAGGASAGRIAAKLANAGVDLNRLGSKVTKLGKEAASSLKSPSEWGTHIANFELGFTDIRRFNITAKSASCLSRVGHCFVGSTLILMSGNLSATKPISEVCVLDLVESRIFLEDRTGVEPSPDLTPLVSSEQHFLDFLEPTTTDSWYIGSFSGEDGITELNIARPISWYSNLGIRKVRDKAWIQLPEMGVANEFVLNKIQKVSKKQLIELRRQGVNQPVTATIRRSAPLILGLQLKEEVIGVTPEHRFYSFDRQEWIAAGKLIIGERLSTRSGKTRLLALDTLHRSETPVYNLEVRRNHNFYVGRQHVLVHNDYSRALVQKLREAYPDKGTIYQLKEDGSRLQVNGVDQVDEFATTVVNFSEDQLNQFYDDLSIPEELNITSSNNVELNNRIKLVKAWEVFASSSDNAIKALRTNTTWLSRTSRWLDEGIEVVASGNVVQLKHSGVEIGRIKNEKLLATDHPYNRSDYNFSGNPIGEVVNGNQAFSDGVTTYVKRVPDQTPFSQTELDILKGNPNAHALEKHSFDVSDEALKLRASEGIAPNGQHVGSSGPPYPTQDGSKFNSADDIRRALSEVGPSTARYQTAFDAAVINGDRSFAVEFTFPNSANSLGYGYRKNTLVQVPEIRKVLAAYKRDDLTGEYYLVTMYPKIN